MDIPFHDVALLGDGIKMTDLHPGAFNAINDQLDKMGVTNDPGDFKTVGELANFARQQALIKNPSQRQEFNNMQGILRKTVMAHYAP